MPPDAYFHCPACGAKLRLGGRPKARVGCPRCGYDVFDYDATQAGETAAEPNIDPFLQSAQSEGSAEETVDPFATTEPSEDSPDEAGEVADFAGRFTREEDEE
jgi:predicted  nucleic acid-binding Zn-ribbon protein